jgi:hypothetical protein
MFLNPSLAGSRRRAAVILSAVGALLLAGAGFADDRPSEIPYDTPGEMPSLNPDYKMTSHKVVLITDQALNPRLVTLDEGQLVAWISYSPIASVVVFEREVARSMICESSPASVSSSPAATATRWFGRIRERLARQRPAAWKA